MATDPVTQLRFLLIRWIGGGRKDVQVKIPPFFSCYKRPIHRSRQWNNTDGISKHRLSPYNAHYLNYDFFYSVSGSSTLWIWDSKLFKVLQFIQHCGKLFHLSVTLFPNTYFLTSSILRLLNNFLEWPLLLPYHIQKIYLRQQLEPQHAKCWTI